MRCRHCANQLCHPFVDLGFAPPSNAYLTTADLSRPEKYYPLRALVCDACWLVQTEDYAQADELFSADYAYFSSTSSSWLAHAQDYCGRVIERFDLGSHSNVVEVASNDGYLLRNFVAAGVPCLGIEPTASTAAAAESLGIPVLRQFFGEALGRSLANEGRGADLIVGNNVYAHVPDINDFTRALKALLRPEGVVTLEFPHILRLIEQVQFDTVYHEHFSYLSLSAVERIFVAAGLRVWDVEELTTHGGSLRVYGCHADSLRQATPRVSGMLRAERDAGLLRLETYTAFQDRANKVKEDLLAFLLAQKQSGNSVAAYGAAAKGNTLLNYSGVKPDLLPYVCDAAPAKQGKFLPGSHIPITVPERLREAPPDFVLILPWNIAAEVRAELADLSDRGTRFVTAIPTLRIW
jgi:SAM-dependent methyltransferase